MMMTAEIMRPALKTTVLTRVIQTHVVEMLFVRQRTTSLCADVQKTGLVILIRSALNVSNINIIYFPSLSSIHPFIFQSVVDCRVDDDCPFDKTCKSNECVDPCPFTICGSRAVCKAERHKGICVCPRGLQGNPFVSCTEVGCQSNDDCSFDEKCNFQTRDCEPLCVRSPCASGARCEAINHRETCTCNYPLQGDGYSSCLPRKIRYCLNSLFIPVLFSNFFHF